jgi:hypothetical protein
VVAVIWGPTVSSFDQNLCFCVRKIIKNIINYLSTPLNPPSTPPLIIRGVRGKEMRVLLVSKCSSSLIFVIEHSKLKTRGARSPSNCGPTPPLTAPFRQACGLLEVEGGGGGGGTFLQSHVYYMIWQGKY